MCGFSVAPGLSSGTFWPNTAVTETSRHTDSKTCVFLIVLLFDAIEFCGARKSGIHKWWKPSENSRLRRLLQASNGAHELANRRKRIGGIARLHSAAESSELREKRRRGVIRTDRAGEPASHVGQQRHPFLQLLDACSGGRRGAPRLQPRREDCERPHSPARPP